MSPIFVLLIFGIAIAGAVFAHFAAKERREAFAQLAGQLGLRFSAEKDHGLADRLAFLDRLDRGSNRYAYNILSGEYEGHRVRIFDYHYQTRSNKKTHHHYFSFFVLELNGRFPELIIAPEGFLSKVAQAFGYDDIDFESHEFSRQFCVRSADRKFAYDVCHGKMMEYLLANPDLSVEIEGQVMAIAFSRCLEPNQIPGNLQRLIMLRSLLPDYIFNPR